MQTINEKKALIKQGWLRVILFCMAYMVTVILTAIPVGRLITIMKKKPALVDGKALMQGEFLWLSVLIGLVISIGLVYAFRKFVDRKSFISLGLWLSGQAEDAWAGFLLAPALLGTGTLILYFSKHLRWTDFNFNGSDLFIEFGILGIAAVSEELVFRAYILNNLMESINRWVALAVSALLFTLFHMDNPGINILPLGNIFLAGILLGLNYIYTRNLWFAILFHLSWNFFQGPLLGFKVSGIHLATFLQTDVNGDLLLTGGDFGFEGSVFDGALTLTAILVLYAVYEKKYRPPLPEPLRA